MPESPFLSLSDLHAQANRARAAYKWGEALGLYTQALESPDLPPATRVALLDGRAQCYEAQGNFAAEQADLVTLGELAQAANDLIRQSDCLTRRALSVYNSGNRAESQSLAEQALELARRSGDRRAEAKSLQALGRISNAIAHIESGLELYRQLDDLGGQSDCLGNLAYAGLRVGVPPDISRAHAGQALQLARQIGDKRREAQAYNTLGLLYSDDHARKRNYYEQAIAIDEELDLWRGRNVMANNLGLLMWRLGLYARARDYAGQAVKMARVMDNRELLGGNLDGLGRSYLSLNLLDQAEQAFTEGLQLCREIGDEFNETAHLVGL
ncbi:MAG TPA: tetratricopeptide repeat protein, partial [Anaerolineales bacterium]|nr:tetratricopeptide repeat protein [Anaerolineales bacterium]